MIRVYFDRCASCTVAPGLTQWDYGQVLEVSGLNVLNAEVHYATAGSCTDAVISVAELEDGVLRSKIPDSLLETGEDLLAYVYVADSTEGETVWTVNLPVKRRQKPGDYSVPEEKNLLREIIEEVKKKADGISLDETGKYLILTSEGQPIGDRIRFPDGAGREIELRNNGTSIEWRYTDSNEWKTLVGLSDLKGEPGDPPEFEIRLGHLYAIYKE